MAACSVQLRGWQALGGILVVVRFNNGRANSAAQRSNRNIGMVVLRRRPAQEAAPSNIFRLEREFGGDGWLCRGNNSYY